MSICQSRSWPWQKPWPNQRSAADSRPDGRHSPAVARDLDRGPRGPRTATLPLRPRQGLAEEPPPEAGGRRAEERASRSPSPWRRPRSSRPGSMPIRGSYQGPSAGGQSRRSPGRRPSSWSFSRCACIAIAAAPRSCSGTSSQTSASSAARERSPAVERGDQPALPHHAGARCTRRSSPAGRGPRARDPGRGSPDPAPAAAPASACSRSSEPPMSRGPTIVEPSPRIRSPREAARSSEQEAEVLGGVPGGGDRLEAGDHLAVRDRASARRRALRRRRCGRRGRG